MDLNEELLHFLDTCPTAYHVVDYIRNTCLKGVEKGEQQPQKEDF